MASTKIIIPDSKVWANAGDVSEPDANRFAKGNESGKGAKPPKDSDHNFQMHRSSVNEQAILREGITEWDANEVYPLFATTRLGGKIYQSKVANNTNHRPDTSETTWFLMFDPDKPPVTDITPDHIPPAPLNTDPDGFGGLRYKITGTNDTNRVLELFTVNP